MELVKALEDARERMKLDIQGIGEPCIKIDPTKLGICGGDPDRIYMTMKDLIEIVRSTL